MSGWSMTRMARSRSGMALAVAGLFGASLVVAVSSGPAIAGPPMASTTSVRTNAPAHPADYRTGRIARVTLLTGDIALVPIGPGADARAVDVRPAEGSGRSSVTYEVSAAGPHDDVYVIPSDARPLVLAGRIDRELFNVSRLVREGLADRRSSSLPVIVTYGATARDVVRTERADALPASRPVVALDSIRAVAMDVRRTGTQAYWDSLTRPSPARSTLLGTTSTRLDSGVTGVYLDGRVDAVLDQSVPQIGAPEAWAAGFDGSGTKVAVLDTGIDLSHPDLADAVGQTANFTEDTTVTDGHGHGTHVASILAGSGDASDGKYRGVAPGADLVVGKVLDSGGSGRDSWVIAGMEWAAADQDADVVNLSLGGVPTDGTDPLSQAVNRLTTQTGALFVIAAGNNGDDLTVNTPGAADAALTVASVSKSDILAASSSRGPRLIDAAVKPEISAPGVGIVAARADGTRLGTPVGDSYVAASGTSMATPHVAGAAAILAQQHPDWTATDLKAALVGSATNLGYTPYEQGAGRVDVARAIHQGVLASPAALNLGDRPLEAAEPIVRTLTYDNTSDQPVTLDLAVVIRDSDGNPVPDGTATLSATSVSVPAHGESSVELTVDPDVAGKGLYSGIVTATDGRIAVRTPVGYHVGDPQRLITVSLTDHEGLPIPNFPVQLTRSDGIDDGDPFTPATTIARTDENGVGTAAVGPGTYEALAFYDQWTPGALIRRCYLTASDIDTRDGDATATIDARDALRLEVSADRLADDYKPTMQIDEWDAAGTYSTWRGALPRFFYASPQPAYQAGRGTASMNNIHTLVQPRLTARVLGSDPMPLHARLDSDTAALASLDGTRRLPLVFVGDGQPEDYEGIDARGKVALVRIRPPAELTEVWQVQQWLEPPFGQPHRVPLEQTAKAHGAALALFYVDRPGWQSAGDLPENSIERDILPTAQLPQAEAKQLLDRLRQSRTRLMLTARSASPWAYALSVRYDLSADGITAANVERHFDQADLAKVPMRFHGDTPAATYKAIFVPERPDQWGATTSIGMPNDRVPVGPLTVFYGPVGPDVHWRNVVSQSPHGVPGCKPDYLCPQLRDTTWYPTAGRYPIQHWFQGPETYAYPTVAPEMAGHVWTSVACMGCRDGDRFDGSAGYRVDADNRLRWDVFGHPSEQGTFALYDDAGNEIPLRTDGGRYYLLPTGQDAVYRMVNEYDERPDRRLIGAEVDTMWTFHSEAVAPDYRTTDGYWCTFSGGTWDPVHPDRTCRQQNLIGLAYDLDLDRYNQAAAGQPYGFAIVARKHPDAPDQSAIAGVTVRVSYDGGATWRPASVTRRADGRYRVTVDHPRLRQTVRFVSLRVSAHDTSDNRVSQTVIRAYNLR